MRQSKNRNCMSPGAEYKGDTSDHQDDVEEIDSAYLQSPNSQGYSSSSAKSTPKLRLA
jgi:hypothetical protein